MKTRFSAFTFIHSELKVSLMFVKVGAGTSQNRNPEILLILSCPSGSKKKKVLERTAPKDS